MPLEDMKKQLDEFKQLYKKAQEQSKAAEKGKSGTTQSSQKEPAKTPNRTTGK